jgi:hypothetical protein
MFGHRERDASLKMKRSASRVFWQGGARSRFNGFSFALRLDKTAETASLRVAR